MLIQPHWMRMNADPPEGATPLPQYWMWALKLMSENLKLQVLRHYGILFTSCRMPE
jgi:hypothetical protein